jgi:hypothetical protein
MQVGHQILPSTPDYENISRYHTSKTTDGVASPLLWRVPDSSVVQAAVAHRRSPTLARRYRVSITNVQRLEARRSASRRDESQAVYRIAVKPVGVLFNRAAAFAACVVVVASIAPPARADPDSDPAPANAAPPTDGRVASGETARVNTPDGWTLTLGAKDESHVPVAPLTTATSSREYLASGTFAASLSGPEEPRGVLEVGYEIGCGIDMSTSNGVTMAGSAGLTPSVGISGPLGALPTAILPLIATPVNGVITVGLKPGIIIVVPVDKKEFKSPDPWIMISNFHVKIDGCVGQSFIRSYATLTRQTDQSDVVLSYVGVTTTV